MEQTLHGLTCHSTRTHFPDLEQPVYVLYCVLDKDHHIINIHNKLKNKKYHTVRTVPKSILKIAETLAYMLLA